MIRFVYDYRSTVCIVYSNSKEHCMLCLYLYQRQLEAIFSVAYLCLHSLILLHIYTYLHTHGGCVCACGCMCVMFNLRNKDKCGFRNPQDCFILCSSVVTFLKF